MPPLTVIRPFQIADVLVCTHIGDEPVRAESIEKTGERSAGGNRHAAARRSQVKVVPALAVIGPLQIMNVLVCTHVQDQLASANGVKKACKGSAIGNRDATAQRSQVKVVPALAV